MAQFRFSFSNDGTTFIDNASSSYGIELVNSPNADITIDNLTITGNLTVNGTQTILNTTTLEVDDHQIELGKVKKA